MIEFKLKKIWLVFTLGFLISCSGSSSEGKEQGNDDQESIK